MKLGGYGCFRIAMYLMPEAAQRTVLDIPDTDRYLRGLRRILRLRTDRLEIHQRLLFRIHCGLVLFAILMMNQTAARAPYSADAFPRTDDSHCSLPLSV